MLSHLSENGYLETATCLEKEANISLSRWQVSIALKYRKKAG